MNRPVRSPTKTSADAAEITRRVLRRGPASGEIERASALVRDADAALRDSQPDATLRRELAWAGYCQALLATNEFRYVD